MTKRFVSDLAAGSAVDEVFLLARRNMAHKKDGNPFLNVTLADRSGQVNGVVWDQVERIAAAAAEGDFVHVRAQVGEYRGGLQMVVKDMVRVPEDQVDAADFLAATTRDVDQMLDGLKTMTAACKRPTCERFSTFSGPMRTSWPPIPVPRRPSTCTTPISAVCWSTPFPWRSSPRPSPNITAASTAICLLAGVILHDVGKTRELDYSRRIDYTDEGRLLSHIVIGLSMLDEKLKQLPDFPEDQAQLLKHMIVSHHGAREFGSPEPPKTIEAVLLNYIDEMDSRVNSIREYVAKDESDGAWTSVSPVVGKAFL